MEWIENSLISPLNYYTSTLRTAPFSKRLKQFAVPMQPLSSSLTMSVNIILPPSTSPPPLRLIPTLSSWNHGITFHWTFIFACSLLVHEGLLLARSVMVLHHLKKLHSQVQRLLVESWLSLWLKKCLRNALWGQKVLMLHHNINCKVSSCSY